MKLAWLIYQYEDSNPEIRFREPDNYYFKVIPIVYAEIQE